jgi:ATP-dependent DNA helicase RecQ
VPILGLNEASWQVMRKQRTVRLVQPVKSEKKKSSADTVSWEGVDRELFEALRELRRELAQQRQLKPYLVFSDATLRQLAGVRPSTLERMRLISGVGDLKLRDFGDRFLQVINDHCHQRGLSRDNRAAPSPLAPDAPRKPPVRPNPQRDLAFEQFRQGAALEDVMHQTGRGRGTVNDYLCDFIREERPASVAAWVSNDIYQRVAACARQVGTDRLKPIFIALGEKVSYDDIRIVLTHLASKTVISDQ